MNRSHSRIHTASPCASMRSLNDDMLRMILMLLPQNDRCNHVTNGQSTTAARQLLIWHVGVQDVCMTLQDEEGAAGVFQMA